MKTAKRLAAIIVTVMMIVTLLPATSFAATKKKAPVKKYAVTVQYCYTNGKAAVKSYKKVFNKGTTTKLIGVSVPQKKGYTVSLAKRTGAAAKKNVVAKLNANKTKFTYQIKKINANVAFKFVYKKKPAPKPATPAVPAEPVNPIIEDPAEPIQPAEPAVETPAEGDVYEAEENGVGVAVTAKDAFAAPVKLEVSGIDEGSDAYETAVEELDKLGHAYDGMIALDVHFTNSETGEEVEPSNAVDVKMQVLDAAKAGIPEEALDDLTIVHILDEGGAEVVSEPVYDEVVPAGEAGTNEFETRVFSTFVIHWSNNTQSATVHYVDTSGNELGNATITPSDANNYMFLVYDFDGYEYDSAHLNRYDGQTFKPLVRRNGGGLQYRRNNNTWSNNVSNNANLYIVYKQKTEPEQGGTPEVDPEEEWPDGNGAPKFSKSSKYHDDGTNIISLSIAAAEKQVESATPADVIVVFDVSGSMDERMGSGWGAPTRLDVAQDAVNTMANTLLNGANHDVRMALISFSTSAQQEQGFTNNYTTFRNKVNGLDAGGGTNWEKALYLANQMEVRDNAATFVVFVTDGDPTFRMSRGAVSDSNLQPDMYPDYNNWGNPQNTFSYYCNDGVFGAGNNDDLGYNFDFAADQVAAIKGANKDFYAIGVSNDVTKVRNLTTEGGYDASHAFIAADEDAMEEAFAAITEAIQSALGFGNVGITDGITEMANTDMKVFQTVDENSFQYYRWGGENNKYGATEADKQEWTTREADGCGPASYSSSDGAVHWNMGTGFQLENGVHYVVTFRVWPSQEAYDLVADLNNGIKKYADLTDAEKAQVVEIPGDPATYALKTNTDEVNATYNKTTKTGDVVTISDEHPVEATYTPGTIENMELDSMKLKIHKDFEDDLTGAYDRESRVTLKLLRRNANQTPAEEFEPYKVPVNGTLTDEIVLDESNDWTYEFYVAPGVITDGEVLEHGYDFTLAEPGIDYHYELIEEIINPMVHDGQLKFEGDGYLIDDDETYDVYVDESLTAVNRVKAGIDVKKTVVDDKGKEIFPEKEFTFRGKILDADGNPFTWQEGDSVDKTGAYHKYDKDGNRIVYKGHFPTTGNMEFTLKAGEYIRFVNVPHGCTFEFDEVKPGETEDYQWDKSEGITQHKTGPADDDPYTTQGDTQPVVDGSKVSLPSPGVLGNKQYVATFTNKAVKGAKFYVYHSSDNTIEKIYTKDDRITEDAEGNYNFNIAAEAKTGTLYGGYYKAFAGAVATDDQIAELAESGNIVYDESGWGSDADGATPYSEANVGTVEWVTDDAYTDHPGTKMHPKADTVYYLKEVPDCYLLPYMHYTYDTGSKELKNMWFMSAIDDLHYTEAGFFVETVTADGKKTATVVDTLTVTNATGGATVKLSPTSIFGKKGVKAGYLTYWDAKAKIAANATSIFTPYWYTPDKVYVTGTTKRTINFNNGKVGAGGMRFTDTVEKKAPFTALASD